MRLYVDCEFNGFRGELISLAVVPEIKTSLAHEYYQARKIITELDPWVKDNVMPILNTEQLSQEEFQMTFWNYIKSLGPDVHDIYADWPEDIAHFCQQLCKPNGNRISNNFSFHLIDSGKLEPKIPHNALEDARALRNWCVENLL